MQLQSSEIEHGIRLIKLRGMLDIMGVGLIERELSDLSIGEKRLIILDLSGVTFIASIGIRLIIMTAKSVVRQDGQLVLLNPIASVKHILELTGITPGIPLYEDLEEAKLALSS
jgi:anti-anti-sigma factor